MNFLNLFNAKAHVRTNLRTVWDEDERPQKCRRAQQKHKQELQMN